MCNVGVLCVVWSLVVCARTEAANECGVPVGMSKIVGGEAVPTLRYPWYVALVQTDISDPPLSVSCGGSLITSRHVLTAAHCFPRMPGLRPEQLYRAVFALVNRCGQGWFDSSPLQRVDIYPSFNQKTLQGDVAVITLPRRVQYMPICLPPKHSTVSGPAQVIGFGSTLAKSQYPCILQEASVNILTRNQCKRSDLEPQFSNLPGIYCAGVPRGGVDSCDGDSGGPLQTLSGSGVYTIQGIVSFGEGCARKNLPGVYTQVSFYRDFIDKVISSAFPEDLPEEHPGVVEASASGVAQGLPPVPSTPPSLLSLWQAWLQGLFRPLSNASCPLANTSCPSAIASSPFANAAADFSSSGSRFPVYNGPVSHRPLSPLQAIIQGIFNRKRSRFGAQSVVRG